MISFEQVDGIGFIRLGINDKNSFSNESFLALKKTIQSAKESNSKAIVLKSDSPGTFSLGLDLTTVSTMDMSKDLAPFLNLFYENLKDLFTLPVPTIAEISGHALGYGAMLALVCDYRYVTEDIRFGLPEVKIGIQVPSFIYALLGEAVGNDAAKRHVLLGDAFKAKEMPALFEEIASNEEELRKKSKSLQTKLKKNSLSAMKDTKAGILSVQKNLLALIEPDIKATIQSIQSKDAQEGISASVQVRRPVFTS